MIISAATFLLVSFLAESTASAASLLSSIASCCLPTFVADDTFVDSPGILLVRDDGCTPIRASCEKDKGGGAVDTTTISLGASAALLDGLSGFDEEEQQQQQHLTTNLTLSHCRGAIPARVLPFYRRMESQTPPPPPP